jgi:glycine hydroxymethyltransferase
MCSVPLYLYIPTHTDTFVHTVQDTGIIDYEELEKQALLFRPKMIICGGSAYPRCVLCDSDRYRIV